MTASASETCSTYRMTPSSLPWRASCALRTVLPSWVVAISGLPLLFRSMIAAEPVFHFRDHRVDSVPIRRDFLCIPPRAQNLQPFAVTEAAVPQHVARRAIDAGRMVFYVFEQFLLGHA